MGRAQKDVLIPLICTYLLSAVFRQTLGCFGRISQRNVATAQGFRVRKVAGGMSNKKYFHFIISLV